MDGPQKLRCVFSERRQFAKVALLPSLRVIVEVRHCIQRADGPHSQAKMQSIGWGVIHLFGQKAGYNGLDLLDGFIKIPLMKPPINPAIDTRKIPFPQVLFNFSFSFFSLFNIAIN